MIEQILPDLLAEDFRWKSFHSHTPPADVLWAKWSSYTIALQCLHPLQEGGLLFAPEPAKSAFRVIKGTVELGTGVEVTGGEIPAISHITLLPTGSSSSISDLRYWSYCSPVGDLALTVSVYGPPVGDTPILHGGDPIGPVHRENLLQEFKWAYGACETQPIPLSRVLRPSSSPDVVLK